MISFITIIDYIGTFAFAISGIRLASAKQFDWFGAYVVGLATAIGGGTLRDILLGVTPFWMLQPAYLVVTACALGFVIVFGKYVIHLNNTFFIFRRHRPGLICRGWDRKKPLLRIFLLGGNHHGNDNRSGRRCNPGCIYQ